MKVVLLAGGYCTRISEESQLKPKPMIDIGGFPILWHIMKEYSHYGFNEFIICAGYKQHVIKEWFADYFLHTSDITFDFTQENKMIVYNQRTEPWKVTIVDTGLNTMTGGRIKRIQPYVANEPFMMTYGDGVCDVDIGKVLAFHREHRKIATLTAVMLEQQKGVLDIGGDNAVHAFREKKQMMERPSMQATWCSIQRFSTT
jgi:glucose-1-phosphate cytidylyltransferase